MRARLPAVLLACAAVSLTLPLGGCQQFLGAASHAKGTTVSVVATASVLASIAESVGGPYVRVDTLVPNGASAETFEPTPREVALLHDANVLLENGAGYETWIGKVISSAANPGIHTAVLSLGLKKINDNPHLWMDPARGRVYARRIRTALIAVDPKHAAEYRHNEIIYERSLRVLQRRIARLIKTVPKNRRGMIVAHDAWRYYISRFGLATWGVIETAPGREPAADHIAEVVRSARLHHVAVIFAEPTESTRLAQAVAAEVPGARVVPLYVDSLGSAGGPVSGYREMLWYDTKKIVAGMKALPVATVKATPSPASDDDVDTDDTKDLEDVHVAPVTKKKAPAPAATGDSDTEDGDLR